MPPSFQVPEPAAETIARALLEHCVPIGCTEESLVQHPVHGLEIEIHAEPDLPESPDHPESTKPTPREPVPSRVSLQALGCFGATLLWSGAEPICRDLRLRLPAFPSLGWIRGTIVWSRAIEPSRWLVGCDFDWLATTSDESEPQASHDAQKPAP